jgi:hypothetical protein
MIIKSIQKLFAKRDRWSIGIFRYDRLEDLFTLQPLSQTFFHGEQGIRINRNYQAVVADPFLITYGNYLHLFYEVKTDHGHGRIFAKSMARDGQWQSHGVVLNEPFHLSYPQVFVLNGKIFMLPESAQSGTVRLYEAIDFPTRWCFNRTLINEDLRDPTLINTPEDGLYILATTKEYVLKMFHAKRIEQQFTDLNVAITNDPKISRCAGSIIKMDNKYIRPAQDCSEDYGKKIHFQTIQSFSKSKFYEIPSGLDHQIPTLNWMVRGSHHISGTYFDNSYYVAIDGRGPDNIVNTFMLAVLRLQEKVNGIIIK